MIERRKRNDGGRKAVSNEQVREAMKQGLNEAFAHLGVDPEQHALDHKAITRILPDLENEVIPWAKAERELANRRKAWFDSVRADLTKDSARLLAAFVLLSLFYGGGQAVLRLVSGH